MSLGPRARTAWFVGLAVAFVFLLVPSQADAVLGFDARGGRYLDPEKWFLGAGVHIGLGPIEIVPNGEYVFIDNATYYTLNVDGTYTVLPMVAANVWVGGGLALIGFGIKDFDTETHGGVNLLIGAGLNAIPLKPFAQFKYIIWDDETAVLAVGARF